MSVTSKGMPKETLRAIAQEALEKLEGGSEVGSVKMWVSCELQKVRP